MKNILYFLLIPAILFSCADGGDAGRQPTNPTGKGGSMARFAMGGDYLYVVDNNSIAVYHRQANGALERVNTVDMSFGIETIFARENNLFLGAKDAMYIYDISDPAAPAYLSTYSHIVSCDPVVVEGDLAYVTLRVGSCHSAGRDALEIINISDLTSPYVLQSYEVATPYGLGIDDKILFLCEGNHGVNIYNAENSMDIKLIKKYPDIHAYDVIPNDGIFIMTGNDGIFQYDYNDPSNIKLLSHIAVN
jgi:hypothetical protein